MDRRPASTFRCLFSVSSACSRPVLGDGVFARHFPQLIPHPLRLHQVPTPGSDRSASHPRAASRLPLLAPLWRTSAEGLLMPERRSMMYPSIPHRVNSGTRTCTTVSPRTSTTFSSPKWCMCWIPGWSTGRSRGSPSASTPVAEVARRIAVLSTWSDRSSSRAGHRRRATRRRCSRVSASRRCPSPTGSHVGAGQPALVHGRLDDLNITADVLRTGRVGLRRTRTLGGSFPSLARVGDHLSVDDVLGQRPAHQVDVVGGVVPDVSSGSADRPTRPRSLRRCQAPPQTRVQLPTPTPAGCRARLRHPGPALRHLLGDAEHGELRDDEVLHPVLRHLAALGQQQVDPCQPVGLELLEGWRSCRGFGANAQPLTSSRHTPPKPTSA